MTTSGFEPSVIRHDGYDYWRTWFFNECDDASLLGITPLQLPWITGTAPGASVYRRGTELFLEDAPWFPHSGNTIHRVCGPYVVKDVARPPAEAEPVHSVDGRIVAYRDLNPQRGPWYNRAKVERLVDGELLVHRQLAGQFEYFPIRLRIVRTPRWHVAQVRHTDDCWLCAPTMTP